MGYKVSFEEVNKIFDQLQSEYEIWAPKRFVGKGRYSDTDIIKYDIHGRADPAADRRP